MDTRNHPRTQCFQFSHDHDLTPVWVFRRATEDGILGLVVNFSEGGLQALVANGENLEAEGYTCFIDGIDDAPPPGSGFKVLLRWTGIHHPLYLQCGFEFADPVTAREWVEYMVREVAAGSSWVRCELVSGPADA
jgi:hypothetical protein